MKILPKRFRRIALPMLVGVVMLGVTTPSSADGQMYLYQYELAYGGKQPVSSFYLSWRPRGMSGDFGFGDEKTAFRMPLYSSDPTSRTMIAQLSMLMNDSEDEDVSLGESLGQAVGAVAALAYFAIPVVAIAKAMTKDIEIPVGPINIPEIPDTPPEQPKPAPSASAS